MTKWTNDSKDDPFGPSFSLNDFKKWMGHQDDAPSHYNRFIGVPVESKISAKKLLSKAEPVEGDLAELAETFKEHGGVIADKEGANFVVEVEGGKFLIDRMYVRRSN